MAKETSYDSFDLMSGLWEENAEESHLHKQFRQDLELYEAERNIVTRLLSQLLNEESKSRD